MPLYHVEALEKFIVRTVYQFVQAADAAQAEERCRQGQEAYAEHKIEDDPGEWLETVSVEEQAQDARPVLYRIYYGCPNCKTAWQEVYESACDSECPNCGVGAITPVRFVEIKPDEEGEKRL